MTGHPPAVVDGLRLRKIMGRALWGPPDRYGSTGWSMIRTRRTGSIMVTEVPPGMVDDHAWIHASISRADQLPRYDELALLHRAVFGDTHAYQVFAPAADHINLHPYALHLWGRADGTRALPDFGQFGTI